MRADGEDAIGESPPEAELLENGMKEVLSKETHKQVGIGRSH